MKTELSDMKRQCDMISVGMWLDVFGRGRGSIDRA